MVNQKFALPLPLLNHIYSRSAAKVKLKLLKSCKQIARKLQRENHKFDVIIFSDLKKPKIRLFIENKILYCQINSGISLGAVFSARRIEAENFSVVEKYLSNICLDSMQELQLWNSARLPFAKLQPLLTPALTSLEIPMLKFVNGDEKNVALKIFKEAPNLKHLE